MFDAPQRLSRGAVQPVGVGDRDQRYAVAHVVVGDADHRADRDAELGGQPATPPTTLPSKLCSSR